MSNYRKVIARVGALLLAFACITGLVLPANAEDTIIQVTDVQMYLPSVIIMRDDVDSAIQKNWFSYSVNPENYTDTLSFEVTEGKDVLEITTDSASVIAVPKDEGNATIRVSSSSGYSKDFNVKVLRGSYATGTRKYSYDYGKSVGETLNIKDIIRENLESYNGDASKNVDFSDELNNLIFTVSQDQEYMSLDETIGTVRCLKEGNATISTNLTCGSNINFNITVTNSEVGGISFNQSQLTLSKNNNYIDLRFYLRAVPDEATAKINWDEVEWTSSDTSILSNQNSYQTSQFYFTGIGETTVTAYYMGYYATVNIAVLDADSRMEFKNSSLYLSVGESETIEYTLGNGNEIVSRSIENGNDVITLDGDTVTAVKDGNAIIKYTDRFGNSSYIFVYVSPKPESISFERNEYVFTMRPDGETYSTEFDKYRSVYTNVQPNNYYPVKYSVVEGDCISFPYQESGTVEPKYPGTATVRAETENGLSATAKVTVKQGTYAVNYDSSDNTIQIKPRESVDLKEEVRKRLISGTDSVDFTDELNELTFAKSYDNKQYTVSDDGIFTALKSGNYSINFTLVNGNVYYLNIIASTSDISMIRFDKDEYWVSADSYTYMNNNLKCIPYYMQSTMKDTDIIWSSSNPEVADFPMGGGLHGKGIEGTTVVTAEYKGLKATTTVHFIKADSKFAPGTEEDNYWDYMDIRLKPGEKTQLKYIIGENNYVISKKCSNDECVRFDPDTDTIEAINVGSSIIIYTDRFHNQIQYQISVNEYPTDFSFAGDINAVIRPGNKGKTYFVNYNVKPFNAGTSIKWEIEGDSTVLEEHSSTYGFSFIPLKAGTVVLRGTTENGLTDTCKITVSEGKYITGFDSYDKRYSISEGETLNLKQIVSENALPFGEDISDDVITYSITEGDDVVNVTKDGILSTKKDGKATVRVLTFGGQWMDVYVSVTDGLKGISFEKDSYSIPWKLNNVSQGVSFSVNLKTDPYYALAGIELNDINVTSSEGISIDYTGRNQSDIYVSGYAYYPGDYTLTAEYNGMKCSTVIHVYEEKKQTKLTMDKKSDIKNGFQTAIPYSFGEGEKTDCILSIIKGDSVSLMSDTASNGVFVVTGLKKGKTTVRVTSVDNHDLYKDIVLHVKDNVKGNYSFTLKFNDEEIKPDSTGTYVMKYGKYYKYEFLSNTKPSTNFAIYGNLVDTGAITADGGAACGLFEDKKSFGEDGASVAGKTGSYSVELWPGAVLKFCIVSDFDKADSGIAKVQNNTDDSLQISTDQVQSLQSQLTDVLADKVTKESLNETVEEISEKSDDLIRLDENARVQLNTDTSVTLSADGKKLIYDITPSISVQAVATAASREIGNETVDVGNTVELTLPVGNFVDPSRPVYVTHVKEDGTKYLYEGTYNETDKTVTFTDPHGFSTFEITQEKTSVPEDVIKPDTEKKPENSVKPDKKGNDVSDKKKAVDTADHSNVSTYALISVFAVMMVAGIFCFRRKHS